MMGKRYGRNQKRKHREELAAVEMALRESQQDAAREKNAAINARYALQEARTLALRELMAARGLESSIAEIREGLLNRFAKEMRQPVSQFMDALGRQKPIVPVWEIADRYTDGRPVAVIEGYIPAQHYCIKVTR